MTTHDGYVHVRGARVHNLKNVDVRIPRDALVVFTGVSGSGKSSLAFGTLYAEAQRRYLESVAPYARRLFHQVSVPEVDGIDGLPPAVALQQQRGAPTTRSSVGSVTTLSNLLRMLYSRAGDYPRGQGIVYAEGFSPNTPEGACPRCHGLGRIYDVTERSMVPDDTLTIRERAIASWPPAWHGQNLRDILVTLGYDVDRPWRELPRKDRDWILYTDETPTVPVYAGYTPAETRRALRRKEEPSYMGTFTGAGDTCWRPSPGPRALDEEARLALHGEHRVPRVPRQAPPARGAQGQVRRARHRRHVPPAAEAHGRDLRTVRGGDGARLPAAQGGASGEGDGRLPHREGPRRPARGADGAGPRLPLARAQHADALARASCSASGSAPRSTATSSAWSTCWTSRRRACTRRTPRRCSGRSTGSRRRATRSSSSSTSSTSCATPTGSWTWGRTRASTAARCSTAGRSKGSAR